MITYKRLTASLPIGFCMMLTACGTSSGTTTNSFFPEIEMDIPDEIYDTTARVKSADKALRTTALMQQGSGPLGHLVERFEKSIDQTNRVLARLNRDAIQGAGTFTGKGPDGNMSGKVETLTDDPDGYDFQATLCQDSTVFQHIRWNTEATKVLLYRDFNMNPVGIIQATTGTFIGKMTYDATDASAVTAEWRSTGTPWRLPPDIASTGDNSIVEYAQVIRDSDGGFLVRGVNDWYTATFPTTPDGQNYAVGYIGSDGSEGKAFGYRNTSTACNSITFNEAAGNWCLGFDISLGSPIAFGSLSSTWASFLEDHATTVPPDSELAEAITMPTGLTCE